MGDMPTGFVQNNWFPVSSFKAFKLQHVCTPTLKNMKSKILTILSFNKKPGYKKFFLIVCSAMLLVVSPSCHHKDNGPRPVKAHDFLASSSYDNLIIEACFMEGYKPSDAAIEQVRSFLNARMNKPAGISIEQRMITSPGETRYTLSEIEAIEKKNRTRWTNGRTLTVFVLFTDGDFSDNAQVLGMAYGATSIVIFEHTVKDVSGDIGQPPVSSLETTILEHEFGHLMGLVDNGSKMIQDHASNGKHCNVQDCLMYYAVETTDIVSNLLGGNIPKLDAKCLEDLRANGGK